jgi:hypothetical protein
LFNPWFFYFNGILPLSESLSTFLLLLGLFIYLLKDRMSSYIVSGFVFGLAILTRFLTGAFISVFVLFALVEIYRKREAVKNILFILAASLFPALWFLRNVVTFGGIFSKGSNYSNIFMSFANIPYMSLVYVFAFVITFLFLVPFIIRGFVYYIKKKNVFWCLVLASSILLILANIWLTYNPASFFNFATSRTRYLTPIVPILTMLAVINFKRFRPFSDRVKKASLICCIAIFMLLSASLSYGFVKDSIDKIIPTSPIYSQRAEHRAEAIKWVNMNLPGDSKVTIIFDEGGEEGMPVLDEFTRQYLRDDLVYVDAGDLGKTKPDFIVTDLTPTAIESKTGLVLDEKFRTNNPPFSYVYKAT